MIQRQQKLPVTVAPCDCKRQPRYYKVGHHLHMLECAPCGHRTGKHPSLVKALLQWKAGERVKLQAVAHG